MNGKFWFVWNEKREVPKRKHPTLEGARTEAKRLSDLYRGHIFYVLESCGLHFKPAKAIK